MFGSLPATRGRLLVGFLLVVVLTSYAVPFAGAAPAAVLIIDHFDAAQGPLTVTLGAPASNSVTGLNVLGNERDLQETVTAGTPGTATAQALNSELRHSQDTGIKAQTLVQWDGTDNSMALNPTGLYVGGVGVDLTQGNTQNGLLITSLLNDLRIDLKFTVYSGADSSTTTLTLPGGQGDTDPPVSYYIPYAAFTTLAGGGADFTNVGAIELLIDGYNGASDLTIGVIETTEFDWGDLPDNSVGGPNYPTTYAANGPRHVIGSLYLGALIDPYELNGKPSTSANGDDGTGVNDEDGVLPTPGSLWNSGANGGSVDVTVSGGPGCLNAWIDWNGDGDMLDSGENILSNVLVDTGTVTHTFFVPTDPHSGSFYARFRLFAPDQDGTCTTARTPSGQAVNGEVEDYYWSFGPNAVNVSSFSGSATPVALSVAGVLVASATALLAGLWKVLRG